MRKRLFAVLLLVVFVISLLAGCGKQESKFLTTEEAQKIAIEALGISKNAVADAHPHTGTVDNKPCYNFHITLTDGTEHNIIIDAATGEILDGI